MGKPKFGDLLMDDDRPIGMFIAAKVEGKSYPDMGHGDPKYPYLIVMFDPDGGRWKPIEDFPDDWDFSDG